MLREIQLTQASLSPRIWRVALKAVVEGWLTRRRRPKFEALGTPTGPLRPVYRRQSPDLKDLSLVAVLPHGPSRRWLTQFDNAREE